jgi:hypothetical protein
LFPSGWDLLPLKLDFQHAVADLTEFGLEGGVGKWVSQLLLELLLFQRDALVLVNFVEIYGDFGDLIQNDAAIIGIDEEQSAVITKLAAEGQFIRIVLITGHFHHMREHQFRLSVFVAQDVDLVMAVEHDGEGSDGDIAIIDEGLPDEDHPSTHR